MNSLATETELWNRADWRALEGIVPFRRMRCVLERLEVGVLRALDPRTDRSKPESDPARAAAVELLDLLEELRRARPALDDALDAVTSAVESLRVQVPDACCSDEPVDPQPSSEAEEPSSRASTMLDSPPSAFDEETNEAPQESAIEPELDESSKAHGAARSLSTQDLERFRERFSARSSVALVAEPHPLARSRATMRSLIEELGDGPELSSEVAIIEELDRLDELTQPSQQERWGELEQSLLGPWLELLVARLRALRDRIPCGSSRHRRHTEVINRLPAFRTEQGGRIPFVHGMRRNQASRSATWAEDAAQCLADLRAELSDEPLVEPSVRPTRRRSPAAGPTVALSPDAGTRPSSILRVLFFGGVPRPNTADAVRRELGLAVFEWHRNDEPRKLESLVGAIRSGRYDVVLHNRFVQHKESEALQRAAASVGVPVIRIRTCGAETIARALAEFGAQNRQAS